MTTERIHEMLKNARAIMAERGLAKGVVMTGDGRVCTIGAITLALYGRPTLTDMEELRPLGACASAMGFPTSSIVWAVGASCPDVSGVCLWNNAPERTLEEVLDRFDQGIEATAPQTIWPRGVDTAAIAEPSCPAVHDRDMVLA